MKKQVVIFSYSLTDRSGQLIESCSVKNPRHLLIGGQSTIEGLEKALLALKKGDKQVISLSAHEAFGYHDDDLVNKIPLNKLPVKVEIGDILEVEAEGEVKKVMRVIDKSLRDVTLDGNHRLAGQDLVFDIEILDIRPATALEIKQKSFTDWN